MMLKAISVLIIGSITSAEIMEVNKDMRITHVRRPEIVLKKGEFYDVHEEPDDFFTVTYYSYGIPQTISLPKKRLEAFFSQTPNKHFYQVTGHFTYTKTFENGQIYEKTATNTIRIDDTVYTIDKENRGQFRKL